jgi:segregation and condensation protein B
VRGVSVRSTIIRTLQEREWIRVVGHRDVPGKPALFGTTKAFLDYFNLASLDDLPSLAEIADMGSLEPELDLEPADQVEREGDDDSPDEESAA